MKTIDHINAYITSKGDKLVLPNASPSHTHNCQHYINVVKTAINGEIYEQFDSFYHLRNLASLLKQTHINFYRESFLAQKSFKSITKDLSQLKTIIGEKNLKSGIISSPELATHAGTNDLIRLVARYVHIFSILEIGSIYDFKKINPNHNEADEMIAQQIKGDYGDFLSLLAFIATKTLLISKPTSSDLEPYLDELEVQSPLYDEFIFSIVSKAIYLHLTEDT